MAQAIRAVRNAKTATRATTGVEPVVESPLDSDEDTNSSFSDVSPLWPQWREETAAASQSNYSQSMPAEGTLGQQPAGLLRPLLFFLLFPLGLAAGVAVVYWLLSGS